MTGRTASAATPAPVDHAGQRVALSAIVRVEQIRLLYGKPYFWLINLITGPVAAWVLWPLYPEPIMLAWIVVLTATIVIRLLLWWRFQSVKLTGKNATFWGNVCALGAFLTGVTWGVLASVVFHTNDTTYHVFVAFTVGGMIAGAALRDSSYLPAFYAFSVPAFVPSFVAMALRGGLLFQQMSLLLTAFAVAIAMMAHANARRLSENTTLRNDQDTLIDDLELMSIDLKRHIRNREQVTAELWESNERFRGIGENAQEAIFIVDVDSNVSYWNPAAERMFGYKTNEIIGRPFYTLLTPERFRLAAEEGHLEFARTGRGAVVGRTTHFLALHKNGTEIPLELSISAMRSGSAWQALGIARDITERNAAEVALREREADLREAQRLAHVGSWVRQSDPDSLKWSEEMFRIFQITPGTEAPRLDELRHMMDEKNITRLREALAKCLRDAQSFTIDLEAQRTDGRAIWVSLQGESVLNADGTIKAMRGTVQDITERKTAEQSIAMLHGQMMENVEALQRHADEMAEIARLSEMMQSCQTRSEAFPIISAAAKTLFPGNNGALALVEAGTRQMKTASQWGTSPTMLEHFSLEDCWGLRTGRRYALATPDEGAPCRHLLKPPAGPSVCLPLSVQGETSGLLHLDYPAGSTVSEATQSLMTNFADVVKLSLSNLRMREILGEQALRDQLTGLFNRHYLVETLPREIQRAQRDKFPLSIALLDIDHFKQLNDRYGHGAGDAVLKSLGGLLRDAMRGGDIACRYGGEEFLLVLPECNQGDARALVQKIRESASRLSLALPGVALPQITVSAGVAEMGDGYATAESFIAKADSALYIAKEEGRDRVEVYDASI